MLSSMIAKAPVSFPYPFPCDFFPDFETRPGAAAVRPRPREMRFPRRA